jgi:hypothetical protein
LSHLTLRLRHVTQLRAASACGAEWDGFRCSGKMEGYGVWSVVGEAWIDTIEDGAAVELTDEAMGVS